MQHDNVIAFPKMAAVTAAIPSRQGTASIIQFSDAELRRQARAQIVAGKRRKSHNKRKSSAIDDEWYRAFGRALFEARVKARVSLEDAAAAAGCSVETWRNYENTGRGRLMYPLLRFAQAYGLRVDDIFDECGASH